MVAAESGQVESKSRVRGRVLAMLAAVAAIAYICRNSIGVFESTIRSELQISKSSMGSIMSVFFFCYALGQIPASEFGRWVGNRFAVAIYAALSAFATALTGLAMFPWELLIWRAANGVAQAGMFPGTTSVVASWFPKNSRAGASGMIAASMSIGGAIGVGLTGILLDYFSWRFIVTAYGYLGIVWAVIFIAWFRNRPSEHPEVGQDELRELEADDESQPDTTDGTPVPWFAILSSPVTRWICGQQFFRAAGYAFFTSWFATYLQETRGISPGKSGILNALPLIGAVLGASFGGFLSDRIFRWTGSLAWARKGVAAIAMSLCAGFVAVAMYTSDPVLAVLVISAGVFCSSVGGPCAYSATIDLGGKHVGALFATMNMVGNLGAALFIKLVGAWLDWAKGPGNLDVDFAWSLVVGSFVVMHVGAAICWLLLSTDGDVVAQSGKS